LLIVIWRLNKTAGSGGPLEEGVELTQYLKNGPRFAEKAARARLGKETLRAMHWQRVVLSDYDIANNKLMQLQDGFAAAHVDAGFLRGAAMFADLADDEVYYFSPRAVEIAGPLIAKYGGENCDAPRSSKVALMCGEQSRAGVPFAPELEESDSSS
jgi:hypothetical protein